MTRVTLFTLFLATVTSSAHVARLQERREAVDAPGDGLELEDGNRFARLETTDEDPDLVELDPATDEDRDLYAELIQYEDDVDESPSDQEIDEEDTEQAGEKAGRACGRRHRLRNHRRRGERRGERRRGRLSLKRSQAAIEKEDKRFIKLTKNQEKRGLGKKFQGNKGDMKPVSNLEPFEEEDEDLFEELNVDDATNDAEKKDELLIQTGGRHRFRSRRKHEGNRRRLEGRRHERRSGDVKSNGRRKAKEDRRVAGAAGGCRKSSRVCCDGSAPTWKMSPKGWHKKMTCADGEKPVCSQDQCSYSVLEYFVSLI